MIILTIDALNGGFNSAKLYLVRLNSAMCGSLTCTADKYVINISNNCLAVVYDFPRVSLHSQPFVAVDHFKPDGKPDLS